MHQTATLTVAPELHHLVPARSRRIEIRVEVDTTSTVQHVVEAVGIPRTEIGALRLDGREVARSYVLRPGDRLDVWPVDRPQPLAAERFLLDVHLGALARRMRLLGIDAAYANQADDSELVTQATAEDRVLLTRDRGLLCRRALAAGAYVRGDHPDEQMTDVLDRFRPRLAPWTRCVACNGTLEAVERPAVAHLLQPGTLRSYDEFARCTACGRPYWHGAHGPRLTAVVKTALRTRDALG